MQKRFFLIFLLLSLLSPDLVSAITFTNGMWSTSFNYGPCSQWGKGGLSDCGVTAPDGINYDWGGASVDGNYSQVVSAANNPVGGGGNGHRAWIGDGQNINSGQISVRFTYQKEVWVRWYERYEAGFKWNPLGYSKELYFTTDGPGISVIVEPHGSHYAAVAQGTPVGYPVDTAYGWDSIMGSSLSDGRFHCYEVHLKMDTNGANGVGQLWIDGILRASNYSVNWSNNNTGAQKGWTSFDIKTNQNNPANGRAMYVDFDDIAVYTSPPPNRDASGNAFIGVLGAKSTDTTAPSVPGGLTASASSSSQINLSWVASTDNVGVAGYKIYRNGTYLAKSTTASYANTGLAASTTYSYKVSAIDAAGNESAQSTAVTAATKAATTADTTAPSVPTGLAASTISSSQINLSWTASTDNIGVTGYKVYRAGALVATASTTTYADSGLVASTAYSYQIAAIDAAGNESGKTTAASATTQAAASGGTNGTTLLQENFNDSNFAARGWYDNTTHGTVVTGGQSGSSLQWAWAKGAQKPTNGSAMRKKFTPTDTLFVSFYVKFQTGWQGSQKTYHPHMFYIPSDLDSDWTPLANNYLNTYIEFLSDVGGTYAIRPAMAIQDEKRVNTSNGTPPNNLTAITENRSVAYCNTPAPAGAIGTCYADAPYYSANNWKASSSSVSTNVWHKVEVYLKMNTISGGKGQANGIMQQWLDGVQVMNRSDVLYRTAQDATKKWAQFVLAPYIGDGSPIAQTMWVDELTVATAPPASSGGSGDVLQPTTPSGLAATATSASQIDLAWTASTDNVGVTGYKIYRNGTYLATTAATSYSNTGLTASTSYSYKVSAIDAAGNESGQSVAATATTQAPPDTTAPSVPAGLSASATSASQINLAWTAATDNVGVTGYKIYRNGTYLATTAATSYSNTGLAAATSYSYKVSAIDAAGNESGQSIAANATTLTTGLSSIWSTTVIPAKPAVTDGRAIEVGVKFQASVSGSITALRFYKGTANTGVHTGNLWTRTGTLLASATFVGETASGWQEVKLAKPVPIQAGTSYIASYYSPSGYFAVNNSYFSAAVNTPPLKALSNAEDGGNGVYKYGSGFPNLSYSANNYWVDVVFSPSGQQLSAPTGFTTAAN